MEGVQVGWVRWSWVWCYGCAYADVFGFFVKLGVYEEGVWW